MRVATYATADRAAAAAARLIIEAMTRNPAIVLGVPTGNTVVRMYRALARACRTGRADFAQVTTFNLDEFAGQGKGDAGSFRTFMETHLFAHVNLDPRRAHVPDGHAADLETEAAGYEQRIARAGGLDLTVLGIGTNGHLAFVEPADALEVRTHVTALTPETRRASAHLFGGRWRAVPARGVTMGIGTILASRRIVLLATGAGKAGIVAQALSGPVTTRVPASLLQAHPDVRVLLDRDAAAELAAAARRHGRTVQPVSGGGGVAAARRRRAPRGSSRARV